MTAGEPPRTGFGLGARVTGMLLRPSATMAGLADGASAGELFRNHVLPLAAVPAVCSLAGLAIFGGIQVASVGVRPEPVAAVAEALTGYAVTLAAVILLSLAVAALSPRFGGSSDRGRALKMVSLAGTPLWVAGVMGLYPTLQIPAALLGGLYALYILYLGLPVLMRVDRNRAITCFAVLLVGVLAIVMARGVLTAWAAELGGPLRAG